MSELSIRVEIAGRAYPLTVQREEEENVRRAASEINESIARLRTHYPMTDKQDLLAMAALEVCARALHGTRTRELTEASVLLDELEALLSPAQRP